jgi:hypothetical protein
MPSTKRPPKQTPTTIGNHKLKPATLMMGYGFDPALSEGSLKAPIFLTSTFVFEKAADGKRFFEGITGKRPARVGTPARRAGPAPPTRPAGCSRPVRQEGAAAATVDGPWSVSTPAAPPGSMSCTLPTKVRPRCSWLSSAAKCR